MGKVRHIAEALQDSLAWGPKDCLEAAIRDIDEGKIKPLRLAVVWIEPEIEGGIQKVGYMTANCRRPELVTILEACKLTALQRVMR